MVTAHYTSLVPHYDNTFKNFTYNDFTYNINKCDIKYMFLFTIRRKLDIKSVVSNVIIRSVTYKYCHYK